MSAISFIGVPFIAVGADYACGLEKTGRSRASSPWRRSRL